MTAWLVTINEEYPQHLQYALEKGFWDFANKRWKVPINPNDRIVFRNGGGGSLVGMFCATVATFALRDGAGKVLHKDREPFWDTPESFEYHYRVLMDPVSVTPVREVLPAEIRAALGAGSANYMFQSPTPFEGDAEDLLAEAFYLPALDLTPVLDGPQISDVLTHDGSEEARAKRLAWVASRVGQDEFRDRLLTSYGGECALTGTAVEESLEAAHIIEWGSGGVNDTSNGILLRADVHRLFDRSLIRIGSRNRVEVDPKLDGTEYENLNELTIPKAKKDRPAPHALRWRWAKKNGRPLAEF